MMLYPAMSDLLAQVPSRYQLVNVVAARARKIAAEAKQQEIVLDDKPVSIAIREIAQGDVLAEMELVPEMVPEVIPETLELAEEPEMTEMTEITEITEITEMTEITEEENPAPVEEPQAE